MVFYQFRQEQYNPASTEDLWGLISYSSNFKEITPDYPDFNITSIDLSKRMYPGMIIRNKVSPTFVIKTDMISETNAEIE